MGSEPKPTVESLMRLIEEERRQHADEMHKARAQLRLEASSRIQWQQRAEAAESKVKAIMQFLGIA